MSLRAPMRARCDRRTLRGESMATSARKSSRAFTGHAGNPCAVSSENGRGAHETGGRSGGPGSSERWVEYQLFGVDVQPGANPRNGSWSDSIRLVGFLRISSEVHGTSTAGHEGAPPVSDEGAASATRPFGVVARGGGQTTEPADSMRAEGAGHTLEADQGHERMPNRLTATRQPGRRTPRRVHDVTMSRHEAHGGSAQPIRR